MEKEDVLRLVELGRRGDALHAEGAPPAADLALAAALDDLELVAGLYHGQTDRERMPPFAVTIGG